MIISEARLMKEGQRGARDETARLGRTRSRLGESVASFAISRAFAKLSTRLHSNGHLFGRQQDLFDYLGFSERVAHFAWTSTEISAASASSEI